MVHHTMLAVNAGSSSVKASLYKSTYPPEQIATASVQGLTAPPVNFKFQHANEKFKTRISDNAIGCREAFGIIIKHIMQSKKVGEVTKEDDFKYIIHRVVHGGRYEKQVVITDDSYDYLTHLSELAPLHNFASLQIIRESREHLSQGRTIAFFDSVFHRTIPDYIQKYPIDQKVAEFNWLRRYGFHGISYAFVSKAAANFLKTPRYEANLILLHLGSGASVCAVQNGKSLDTSMGLSPLEGLPGATRSGSIDPCLMFHYTSNAGGLSRSSTSKMRISQAEELLNKGSGWKALTGSTDFSQIGVENPPTDMHRLAFDIFVDRIVGYIGSYFVKLSGKAQALVFAGGIGENSPILRKAVTEKCNCLGFTLDEKSNEKGPGDDTVVDISPKNQERRVLICQTDEMYQMAQSCIKSQP